MAANVERIDVASARQKVTGGRALLVCGYEDDAKCRKDRLEGSIPFARFEARYIGRGYNNAKALRGGVQAWMQAGLPTKDD